MRTTNGCILETYCTIGRNVKAPRPIGDGTRFLPQVEVSTPDGHQASALRGNAAGRKMWLTWDPWAARQTTRISENVEAIANPAVAAEHGWGRQRAGLRPSRGHSKGQGIGAMGVHAPTKTRSLDRLQDNYGPETAHHRRPGPLGPVWKAPIKAA